MSGLGLFSILVHRRTGERHHTNLKNVEKLKGLHLKAKAAVHQQHHQVGHLSQIHHGVEIIFTLKKSQPLLLACRGGW
jgi:hypothetical protein